MTPETTLDDKDEFEPKITLDEIRQRRLQHERERAMQEELMRDTMNRLDNWY